MDLYKIANNNGRELLVYANEVSVGKHNGKYYVEVDGNRLYGFSFAMSVREQI